MPDQRGCGICGHAEVLTIARPGMPDICRACFYDDKGSRNITLADLSRRNPTDTLARLRAALEDWRSRNAEVKVSVEVERPRGTSASNPEGDVVAAMRYIDEAVRHAPALLDVVEAATSYLAEMGNPAPCHVMRKQHRQAMRDALERLGEVGDGS